MDIPRPWYKKKRFLIPIGAVGLMTAISVASSHPQPQVQSLDQLSAPVQQQNQIQTPQPVIIPLEKSVQDSSESNNSRDELSNDDYYRNVDGGSIHSPAYSEDNDVPAGASAQCGDGTYSFSAHRQGTCSHHGGVDVWY